MVWGAWVRDDPTRYDIKRDTQADKVNTSIGVKFGKDYEESDSDMIRDLT